MAKTGTPPGEWTVTPILVKASPKPEIVTLPARMAVAIDGRGAPGSDEFQRALAALYGVAYGLKFARKKSGRKTPFKVAALEGRWLAEAWTDRSRVPPRELWVWRLRLAVPPDTTKAEVAEAARAAATKKGGKLEGSKTVDGVFLEKIPSGRCGRILHRGPYADEPRSFAALATVIEAAGARSADGHIEVYLGDPRRVAPEKMKTVLLKALL